MKPVEIEWYAAAKEDLKRLNILWQSTDGAGLISLSIEQIESLLKINPASIGWRFALSQLDDATTKLILRRRQPLPEDLRWLRHGRLEVFFLLSENEDVVSVIHVRPRQDDFDA